LDGTGNAGVAREDVPSGCGSLLLLLLLRLLLRLLLLLLRLALV